MSTCTGDGDLVSVGDGDVTNPSLKWTSEENSGWYLENPGPSSSVALSKNSRKRLWVDSSGETHVDGDLNVTGAVTAGSIGPPSGDILLDDGTAAAPSLAFASHTDSGMYFDTTGPAISQGGVKRMKFDSTLNTSSQPVALPGGSASAPSLCFSGDTSSGFYSVSSSLIGISCGGAVVGIVSPNYLLTVGLNNGTGAMTSGSYSFSTNSGFSFNTSSTTITTTVGGGTVSSLNSSTGTYTIPISFPGGTGSSPGVNFNGNTNSGLSISTAPAGLSLSYNGSPYFVAGSTNSSLVAFTAGTNSLTGGSTSVTSLTSSGTMSCGSNSMTCGALNSTNISSSNQETLVLTGTTGQSITSGPTGASYANWVTSSSSGINPPTIASSTTVTINKTGNYYMAYTAVWASTSQSGNRNSYLQQNGSTQWAKYEQNANSTAGLGTFVAGSDFIPCTNGDTFTLVGAQGSGGPLNLGGSPMHWSIYRLP